MRRPALLLVLLGLGGAALGIWLRPRLTSDAQPVIAERVVLFAPNLGESAFALGYGERVVAITDYCVWPAAAMSLPRVGGMIDPNLERLAALAPDLLIVQGEATALRQFARQQNVRLAAVKMDDDVKSVFDGFARLDSLLGGDGTKARQLSTSLQAELDSIAASVAGASRPRTLISLGHDPQSLENLYAVGAESFLGELLEVAGADNCYSQISRSYFLLSLETLAADPPDLVLELRPGAEVSTDEEQRLRQIWQALDAEVRVEVLQFDGLMIPGPRIGATARAFRDAAHPELVAVAP